MSEKVQPQCRYCPFCEPGVHALEPVLKFKIYRGEYGRCRRRAPVAQQEDDGNHWALFPMVDLEEDWCGEHPEFGP